MTRSLALVALLSACSADAPGGPDSGPDAHTAPDARDVATEALDGPPEAASEASLDRDAGPCPLGCPPWQICGAAGCEPCPGGLTNCGGPACVDLVRDPANCGTCGRACMTGQSCDRATCR
jgi:hypothetical protein